MGCHRILLFSACFFYCSSKTLSGQIDSPLEKHSQFGCERFSNKLSTCPTGFLDEPVSRARAFSYSFRTSCFRTLAVSLFHCPLYQHIFTFSCSFSCSTFNVRSSEMAADAKDNRRSDVTVASKARRYGSEKETVWWELVSLGSHLASEPPSRRWRNPRLRSRRRYGAVTLLRTSVGGWHSIYPARTIGH